MYKKKLENAIITKLCDNTYADENDPIVSLSLRIGREIGGTRAYRESYHSFMKALMNLLEVETKQEIEGKNIMVCSDWREKILALGNEEGIKWIESDPKIIIRGNEKVYEFNIIEGDIIKYLEEKERQEELGR